MSNVNWIGVLIGVFLWKLCKYFYNKINKLFKDLEELLKGDDL